MLLETALLAHLLTTAPAPPPSSTVPAGRYVLVNGLLSPGEWDDALAVPLDAETDLRIKQDDRSVFLALIFKGPRHTGLDLYWSTGGPPEMFHVSSALGERHGKDGAWSDMEWGTNRLWTANPVGLVSGAGGQQLLAPEAFELQIDRARLGGLDLRLFVHLKRPEKKLPAGAALEKPESWLAVRLPSAVTSAINASSGKAARPEGQAVHAGGMPEPSAPQVPERGELREFSGPPGEVPTHMPLLSKDGSCPFEE